MTYEHWVDGLLVLLGGAGIIKPRVGFALALGLGLGLLIFT